MLHDLLPVNREMNRRNASYSPFCAGCGCQSETCSHLYECPHIDFANWRRTFQRSTATLCDKLSTEQVVKHLLLTGIVAGWSDSQVPLTDFTPTFHPVIIFQSLIGWSQLNKGHFSLEWDKLHLKLTEKENTRINWTTQIIKHVWSSWFDLWLLRNSVNHGKSAS